MAAFKIAYTKRAEKQFERLIPLEREQIVQAIKKKIPDYGVFNTSRRFRLRRPYDTVFSSPYRIFIRVDICKQSLMIVDIDHNDRFY